MPRAEGDLTANTVLRVSKALLNDISSEDNIPFYDKFVEDVAKLESTNGVLSPSSELRKRHRDVHL